MKDVRYWVWQAKAHKERGSRESELADWTEAIRLAPEDASLYMARTEVRIRLEQFPDAVADYQLAFQLAEPADQGTLLAIGSKLRSKLAFDPNEALITVLSKALEADRGNELLLLQQRADLYAAFERWDEAAADDIAILQLRHNHPNRTTGLRWSSDRSKFLQNLAGNKALFDALRKQLPDVPELWLARGRSLALRSEWQTAAEAFGRFQEAVPVDSEVGFEIACSQRIVGDEQGYRKLLTRLYEQAGENPSPFAAFVLARTTGLAPQDPDLAEQAVEWAQQAVNDSKNAWNVHALGLAQYRAGDHVAAIKTLLTSLESGWDKSQSQVVLALACDANNDRTQAQQWLTAARKSQAEKKNQAIGVAVRAQVIDWLAFHALLLEAKMQIEEKGGNN